jgi:predicted Zn-dependent protease
MHPQLSPYGFKFFTKVRPSFQWAMPLVAAAVLAIAILLFSRVSPAHAVINAWYGTGIFPTNNLNRCHSGNYATEAQNASAAWSSATDLNMFSSCSGTHITTKNDNWGNTGWAGFANVCATNGQCSDGGNPWNWTFTSCEARLNQWSFNNNPGFYTSGQIQILATHELGHCYGLDHATNTSVMNASSTPQTQDINLINARY